jgi:hypothetical protein
MNKRMVFRGAPFVKVDRAKREMKKSFKKSEKISKKVLTFVEACAILHERSKRERQKQRSLKIEQQIERTK